MKAQHRHELKTNELAQWLVNLPNWVKENYKMIIYVSVVVIAIAAAAIWKQYERTVAADSKYFNFVGALTSLPFQKMGIIQAQARGVDQSYSLIQAADNFENVAQTAPNDQMAALALIKKGDAIRAELHLRAGIISNQDTAFAIEKAKQAYSQALAKAKKPLLTAMANMALGLCEEELTNFDAARQIYQQIASDSSLEGTPAKAEAKLRLITMQDYREKPVIAPSPEPAFADIPRPQIELPPVDISLPTP